MRFTRVIAAAFCAAAVSAVSTGPVTPTLRKLTLGGLPAGAQVIYRGRTLTAGVAGHVRPAPRRR